MIESLLLSGVNATTSTPSRYLCDKIYPVCEGAKDEGNHKELVRRIRT